MNHKNVTRAYVDGIEIDKIPELARICAMDDWISPFLEWAATSRKKKMWTVLSQGGENDPVVTAIHVGSLPEDVRQNAHESYIKEFDLADDDVKAFWKTSPN